VRASQPEILPELEARLLPGVRPSTAATVDLLYSVIVGGAGSGGARSGTRRFHLVYAGAAPIARTHALDEALEIFRTHLKVAVAEAAPRRIFVHAGVVGWRGRAIVLPGRTFTGKSTLVHALCAHGASYLSDEFAVFDEQGRVHPYHQPLNLREGAGGREVALADLERLPGSLGRGPLEVDRVLFSRFKQGRRTAHRAITQGEAVLQLLRNTLPARRRPVAALAVLSRVVGRAHTLEAGVRGEARIVAERLLCATDAP
jgi:hypothetical protein